MRRARAYTSFCSQFVLVYVHPFRRNLLFCNHKSHKISKNSTSEVQNHLRSSMHVKAHSGVFRIWQRGHVERAKREPITGVWGRSPQRGPEAEPLVGGSGGRSPLEAKTPFASECLMETANSPIFLKFGNAKDHQTLLNFAILAGKWQKTHLFL